tara:strand:- start:5204 stop:6214 length:1011 start_codon:yes stop_codon:yes gene_type:complete
MKTKIIAEIGVNHDGSIEKAMKLIDIAKKCNAHYAKFQLYKTDNLVTKKSPLAKYQMKNIKIKSQYDLLKKYEFDFDKMSFLKKYCDKKKINFLCSPFDDESADFLVNKLNQKLIKVPSGEIDNFPMLKILIKKNIKLIISTGMSELNEILKTYNFLKKNNYNVNKNLTFLHCVSSYPTKIIDMNLNFINTLRNKFNVEVGLSDHTKDISIAKFVVALNCSFIEKHITLSNKMTGPDHSSSLNPNNFKDFANEIFKSEIIMGKKLKTIKKNEAQNKKIAKKSIYAKRPIKKNEKFTKHNIILKRPMINNALSPDKYFLIIGKKSNRDYSVDSPITK